MTIEVYHWWLTAAIFFVMLEVFIPSFKIIWFGVGGLAAALVAYLGGGTNWQIFVFGVVSGVLVFMAQTIFKKFLFPEKKGAEVKTNVGALSGRIVVVLEPITSAVKPGTIKIGGEVWTAYAESSEELPFEADSEAEIVRIEGAKAFVKKPAKSDHKAEEAE